LGLMGDGSELRPDADCTREYDCLPERKSMLGEAHASLAWVHTWYEYDFTAAEREFERSLELNPRYATAHQFFGFYLGMMGRYEEAYTEAKRAIRLDPLSSVFQWSLGFVYCMVRRHDQAIEQDGKAVAFDT